MVVADAAGRRRRELVGRVKIERRPLVLIHATTPDGAGYSILLQNAETVKLVGPRNLNFPEEEASALYLDRNRRTNTNTLSRGVSSDDHKIVQDWRTISVSQLCAGDEVYVLVQDGARHTGIRIEESICER